MTATVLSGILTAAAAIGAVFYLIRQHKKGCCCGCSQCKRCLPDKKKKQQ